MKAQTASKEREFASLDDFFLRASQDHVRLKGLIRILQTSPIEIAKEFGDCQTESDYLEAIDRLLDRDNSDCSKGVQ